MGISKVCLGLGLLLVLVMATVSFEMIVYPKPDYKGKNQTFKEVGIHLIKGSPGSYRWEKEGFLGQACIFKTCWNKNRVERFCPEHSEPRVAKQDKFNWVLIWCIESEPSCSDNPENMEPLPTPVEMEAEVGNFTIDPIDSEIEDSEIEDSSIVESQVELEENRPGDSGDSGDAKNVTVLV